MRYLCLTCVLLFIKIFAINIYLLCGRHNVKSERTHGSLEATPPESGFAVLMILENTKSLGC